MVEKYEMRKIVAIGFGANILEWYDFSIYAYVANILGLLFFDEHNEKQALIKAFFVFSLSFLVRPLGSIFFGFIGDRFGRRFSLQFSLILMAFPTFLIGLLPTYSTIGSWALSLLILLRLAQGFAAGGELPGIICYLYEAAPKQSRRNFLCSLSAASSMLGVLLGSITVYLLHVLFSETEIKSWAWRIPFWLGSIVVLTIFNLRKRIKETETFKKHKLSSITEYGSQLKSQKNKIAQIFLLNTFISIAFYLLFVWMPSYLLVFNDVSANVAFFSSSLGLTMLVCFTLMVGYFAKEEDKKKWIISGVSMMILFSYPLFKMFGFQSFAEIFIPQLLFASALSCIDGVINSTMGSIFGDKIRYSCIGIGYTLPTAFFGGLAPTISTLLIYYTGSKVSPVLLLIISGVIALLAAIKLPAN